MSGNIHTLGEGEGGGRSLGGNGNSEPLPAAWANRSSQPRIGRIGGPSTPAAPSRGTGRLATLRDLASQQPPSHSSRRGQDDDDDDDDTPQNFFAGGERSGLSVENPNHGERRGAHNQVRDILKKAAEGGRAPAAARESAQSSRSGAFSGRGHTLGSEETESQEVPDPNADPEGEETAIRHITFWRNGFTIENGTLQSYDNPESAELLEALQHGLAPPEVLNIRPRQPVELRVAKRLDEEYVPPPPGPFSGTGNRLGSPIPATVQPESSSAASAAPAVASSSSSAPPASFEVDMSAPTTSIQIRLADGTRLVSRMNLTHTIGDIRRFINASRPGNSSRSYAIQTPFPVKLLEDDSQTIEAAGLKNSVVIQRWL